MRAFALLAATAAALVLAGCGNRRLVLSVDALSFTPPEARAIAFGPVPALPVPIETGEITLIDDQHVHLFDGAHSVLDVQDVTLTFAADLVDSTGDGLDTLRIYMSSADTAPASTAPVIELPVTLVAGQHVPVTATVHDDPRLNALFTQQEMRMSVTTSLRGPSGGEALTGRVVLSTLRAEVVAKQHAL